MAPLLLNDYLALFCPNQPLTHCVKGERRETLGPDTDASVRQDDQE